MRARFASNWPDSLSFVPSRAASKLSSAICKIGKDSGTFEVPGEHSRNFHHGIGIAVDEVPRRKNVDGTSAVHNGSDDTEELVYEIPQLVQTHGSL